MKKYLPLLNNVTLFRSVSPEDLESMLGCLNATVATYKKQDIILLEGQPVKNVGIVLEGAVQIIREDYLGNRNIMVELSQGDLFAEAYSCVQTNWLPVTVVSVTDSEIMWIDYKRIISTCSSACKFHLKLIENMLTILAGKNIMLSQKIEHISKRTTREKLLSYLSDQAARQGGHAFDIPFSRQALADYLCVDRSAMSAELSRLRDDGILTFERNHFVLLSQP